MARLLVTPNLYKKATLVPSFLIPILHSPLLSIFSSNCQRQRQRSVARPTWYLVVGALQEGRVDAAEGLEALDGHTRGEGHGVLLCDAHVERALRKTPSKEVHAGATFHEREKERENRPPTKQREIRNKSSKRQSLPQRGCWCEKKKSLTRVYSHFFKKARRGKIRGTIVQEAD